MCVLGGSELGRSGLVSHLKEHVACRVDGEQKSCLLVYSPILLPSLSQVQGTRIHRKTLTPCIVYLIRGSAPP